ncbi:MAG: type 2 isopentenyl-diphosphate Delta-isomerase [Chloroflexi bacterium]|nr:type 2 isopentenyl-diphosphate Delta-isomerase [Chloroflexota bacterium]MCL5949123.1 type 2 isopentenyl-diphosphate Delta-isomerase [Candidatus Bathyarchaeota archaeon]
MAETTGKRKKDHIRICLGNKAQAKNVTAGFEDIQLVHRALPEINKSKINLSTTFLGKKFNAPIIVGAMTGGAEEATKINASIAEAVEKLGLGMGVGSQRAAIEDPNLEKTYRVAREKAPHAFLIANIGGVQLVHGYGIKEVKKTVEMIDADAVAVHLNALQEAVQPEGQTNFKGVLAKIGEIAGALDTPVIVKETGAGISAEDAKALEDAGVKAIDVGGVGGTSFAAVEYYRSSAKENIVQNFSAEAFWDWGIPTAVSLIETVQTVKLPVIASGGIRSGTDIAKALALNASLASISQPILQTAVKSAKATEDKLSCLIEELRNALFLVGAEKLSDLSKMPVVITGKTGEWLQARGFNLQKYAKRGAR